MRYVGVVFYDMDKVEAMAATKNEQDIYENTLDLILDPHDPEVIKRLVLKASLMHGLKQLKNLLYTNL